MDTDLQALLTFNNDGFLNNVLAVEEHLVETPKGETTSAWCTQKHTRIASEHHLKEAIEHAESAAAQNPSDAEMQKLAADYRKFKGDFDDAMKRPDLATVRHFRNRFRGEFMPETNPPMSNTICRFDTCGKVWDSVMGEFRMPPEKKGRLAQPPQPGATLVAAPTRAKRGTPSVRAPRSAQDEFDAVFAELR